MRTTLHTVFLDKKSFWELRTYQVNLTKVLPSPSGLIPWLASTCNSSGAGTTGVPQVVQTEGVAGDLHRQYCSSVLHLFSSWSKVLNLREISSFFLSYSSNLKHDDKVIRSKHKWSRTCRSYLSNILTYLVAYSNVCFCWSANCFCWSVICFCWSAVFFLHTFSSWRNTVSWLLYRFMPCLILRMRLRNTMLDCGISTYSCSSAHSLQNNATL